MVWGEQGCLPVLGKDVGLTWDPCAGPGCVIFLGCSLCPVESQTQLSNKRGSVIQVFLRLSFKSIYKGELEIPVFSAVSIRSWKFGSLCSLSALRGVIKIALVFNIHRSWQLPLGGPCAYRNVAAKPIRKKIGYPLCKVNF